MNRIAGIFNLDGEPVRAGEIERMVDSLKWQRSDAGKIWIEGNAGLACTRSGERPGGSHDDPLSSEPGAPWVIAFDGRIDDRQELLAALKPQGLCEGSEQLNEELVLAAYEKWGADCPEHLTGDFAFAIWDRKKQRLVCGRDHFGVKPFYYSLSGNSFVFASTPLAILVSGKAQPAVHEERIADLLMEFCGRGLEAVDKTSSFYREVFRLPPAHTLIIQAGGMTLKRYWELCPTVSSGLRMEEEYLEAFQELFAESVRCRLRDVAAPASMLSGGMDSSAIVGMARRILAEEGRAPLHAFAVISDCAGTNRETAHISSVVRQGGLQPHLVSQTELGGWIDELVKAIEAEAEPFDCLMNLGRAAYLHARDQGVDVLLDGVDGDLLLSDSHCLPPLWKQGAFGTILSETLLADGVTSEYKMGRRRLFDSLVSVFPPYVTGWLRQMYRRRREPPAMEAAVHESIIEREFAICAGLDDRLARLHSYGALPRSPTQMDAHKIDLDHPNLPAGLERYERVASSFGVEARHPFTDVRLAEFCLGLPWQLKTQHGWTKMILRRAMEPYLPPEVVWRKDKDSLMWEVSRLILKERAEYFYQITSDERRNLKAYVDVQKLMKFWNEYLTLGDETHALLIWSGLALALWLRRHREMTASLGVTL